MATTENCNNITVEEIKNLVLNEDFYSLRRHLANQEVHYWLVKLGSDKLVSDFIEKFYLKPIGLKALLRRGNEELLEKYLHYHYPNNWFERKIIKLGNANLMKALLKQKRPSNENFLLYLQTYKDVLEISFSLISDRSKEIIVESGDEDAIDRLISATFLEGEILKKFFENASMHLLEKYYKRYGEKFSFWDETFQRRIMDSQSPNFLKRFFKEYDLKPVIQTELVEKEQYAKLAMFFSDKCLCVEAQVRALELRNPQMLDFLFQLGEFNCDSLSVSGQAEDILRYFKNDDAYYSDKLGERVIAIGDESLIRLFMAKQQFSVSAEAALLRVGNSGLLEEYFKLHQVHQENTLQLVNLNNPQWLEMQPKMNLSVEAQVQLIKNHDIEAIERFLKRNSFYIGQSPDIDYLSREASEEICRQGGDFIKAFGEQVRRFPHIVTTFLVQSGGMNLLEDYVLKKGYLYDETKKALIDAGEWEFFDKYVLTAYLGEDVEARYIELASEKKVLEYIQKNKELQSYSERKLVQRGNLALIKEYIKLSKLRDSQAQEGFMALADWKTVKAYIKKYKSGFNRFYSETESKLEENFTVKQLEEVESFLSFVPGLKRC